MSKKDKRSLKTHVAFHRTDAVGNVVESLTLGPDDDRPDWVHEQLADGSREHLFVGGPEQPQREDTDPGNGGQVDPPENASPKGQQVDPHSGAPVKQGDPGEQPPKGGPGSGRDAWAAYAQSKGVPVDEQATRDDIFDALESAGIKVS